MDARWRQLQRTFAQDPTAISRIISEAIRSSVFTDDYLYYLRLLKSPYMPEKIISTQQRIFNTYSALVPHNSYIAYQRGLRFFAIVLESISEDPEYKEFRPWLSRCLGVLRELKQFGPNNQPALHEITELRAQVERGAIFQNDDRGSLMEYIACEIIHILDSFDPAIEACDVCGEYTVWDEVLGSIPGSFILSEYHYFKKHGLSRRERRRNKKANHNTTRKQLMKLLIKNLTKTENQLWYRFHQQFVPGQIWN